MNIDGLDKMDNAILEAIKDNARMSYSDIGDIVGLSRVAVKKRMEAMEKKGIIKGYVTVIDETIRKRGIRMFSIGDKVVYPMHGAGTIESIEEQEIEDTKKYWKN